MTDSDDICVYLNTGDAAPFDPSFRFPVSHWTGLIHPEDHDKVTSHIRDAHSRRREYQTEYRILKRDGGIRWMRGCASPRLGEYGDYAGYFGVITDVSQQHENLRKLQESEANYRLLTENSTDLVCHHAPDSGNCLYVSPSVIRILGFDAAEMTGASVYALIHPEDRSMVRDEVLAQTKGAKGKRPVEVRVRRKDGIYLWFETTIHVLLDGPGGAKSGAITVSRDITAAKVAQEKLLRSEARFRSLTNLSSDWYWETDTEGRFIYVSEGVRRHFAQSPDELIGKTPFESGATQPAFLEYMEKVRLRQPFRALPCSAYVSCLDTLKHAVISGEPVFENGVFRGYRGIGRDVTHEREAAARQLALAEELRQSRSRLAMVLESIGDALYVLDREWRFVYVNDNAASFHGARRSELLGKLLWDVVPAAMTRELRNQFHAAVESGAERCFELYWSPNASWLEMRVFPAEDGISAYFHDITARRAAAEAIRISEQRFREVIEMAPSAYLVADAPGIITEVNNTLCAMSGYRAEELTGHGLDKVFAYCPWQGTVFARGGPTTAHAMEAVLRHKDGQDIHVLLNGSIKRDADGEALSLTVFLTDITARKQTEHRLERLARHDPLTGLPNRSYFNAHLRQLLARSTQEDCVAVFFIDLDRFKEVNDSFGHGSGDALLCEVGERLSKRLRPGDFVARLGGDEFVVVAPCTDGRTSAGAIAAKLLAALEGPVQVMGQEIYVGASIGISIFPDDGASEESLFQSADMAMYKAKAAGRNCYRFFEPAMSVETRTRMALGTALHHAIGRNELYLNVQPRVDLATMTVSGIEALVRWNSPQLGQVPPLHFIPIAEENGLIEVIGTWVLEQACRETVRIMQRFERPLHVSVNLSARQLKSKTLVHDVSRILAATGLPSYLLELELTETALIDDIVHSASVLKELKQLGVRLAVDDFGTGYSGLAYLRRFPLDVLKLDRSFLAEQEGNARTSVEFVKAFIDMAHALQLSVVAEGVETAQTLDFLRSATCDEAQGYLLAKPMSPADFEALLARHAEGAGWPSLADDYTG